MPSAIPDLWPDEVAVTDVLTPSAIMRYQAGQLREKTKSLLEGEVQTAENEGWKLHSFDLLAPALNRYRYRLFSARHRKEMVYPVIVESPCLESKATRNALLDALGGAAIPLGQSEAATQQEFIDLIGKVLRSDHAKSVIQSLIAQSQDARSGT